MNEAQAPMSESRQNAIALLRQRAKRLRIQAAGLEALADAMPKDMSEEAESALWSVVIGR